jgi:hypothetical protein
MGQSKELLYPCNQESCSTQSMKVELLLLWFHQQQWFGAGGHLSDHL